MNFNQLRYILSVDTFRNFAKAADHCGVAQSTMSKEIQRLEKEFGIILFDRSRHPVVPTMKGADLLEQARKILEAADRFREMAEQKENPAAGSFMLGILPDLAPYLLPLFVKRLEERYPRLSLTVSELGIKEIDERLGREELDGAIVIAPFPKEGYYETALFKESFVLYMSQDHPLAALDKIRWADIPFGQLLLHEDIRDVLTYGGNERTHRKEAGNLRPAPKVTYQSGSLETIRKIIDRNGGITLLPETACLYMGERRIRMVRKIEPPAYQRTISLVTPRGFQKNRLTKAIVKEIRECVGLSL